MQETAIAQPNIALIKYWGKRDTQRNLPAVGSISITLRELFTRMAVEFDASLGADTLTVNGAPDHAMLPRLASCLDRIAGPERHRARIASDCNFPIAAGLASSALAFAAITVAAAAAADKELDRDSLASLAGQASGSAARSLFGGYVELKNMDNDIRCATIADAAAWPLSVVVAITEAGPKAVGSSAARDISRLPAQVGSAWIERQDEGLGWARAALVVRDVGRLAAGTAH